MLNVQINNAAAAAGKPRISARTNTPDKDTGDRHVCAAAAQG
jgi:hypothetical protein